jgi:ectoine hydroxylase-related dioxygenase (phytanoyl-CoA dioxygenase family)
LVDRDAFDEQGYTIIRGVCPDATADLLIRDLDAAAGIVDCRGGARFQISQIPTLETVARSCLMAAARDLLACECFPVRAIYFDKTQGANWKVAWHQDLTIAVARRHDVPDFGPWTEKNGVPHVQPPVRVLEGMVAIRLHLDECGVENGPLRVIPGSHTAGRLMAADITAWRHRIAEVVCESRRGDVLAMRPLLLHASSAALAPAHRRVLHIEYASTELPNGLQWFERCA